MNGAFSGIIWLVPVTSISAQISGSPEENIVRVEEDPPIIEHEPTDAIDGGLRLWIRRGNEDAFVDDHPGLSLGDEENAAIISGGREDGPGDDGGLVRME